MLIIFLFKNKIVKDWNLLSITGAVNPKDSKQKKRKTFIFNQSWNCFTLDSLFQKASLFALHIHYNITL